MSSFTPLRLIAKDLEDIKVLSSCVQDAILPLKEMAFMPEEQQFALLIQRFCWECTQIDKTEINQDNIKRIHSALIFSHISSYKTIGIEENMITFFFLSGCSTPDNFKSESTTLLLNSVP